MNKFMYYFSAIMAGVAFATEQYGLMALNIFSGIIFVLLVTAADIRRKINEQNSR